MNKIFLHSGLQANTCNYIHLKPDPQKKMRTVRTYLLIKYYLSVVHDLSINTGVKTPDEIKSRNVPSNLL